MYKLTGHNSVIRIADGACIPFNDGNRDYEEYKLRLAEGYTPIPADPVFQKKVTSVSMRQARLALLEAGLLDDVEMVIAGAGPAAKIEWDYAHEVHRDNPLIAVVQAQQGMTEAQIDSLFERAATL